MKNLNGTSQWQRRLVPSLFMLLYFFVSGAHSQEEEKHIFLVDPVAKLALKKDSSLMMATTLKNAGKKAYLMFEEDLYLDNTQKDHMNLRVYDFENSFEGQDEFYMHGFKLGEAKTVAAGKGDNLYMRLDPPFDTRYQGVLLLLDKMQDAYGVKVSNNPAGIMKHNEKLLAYYQSKTAVPSYVGKSVDGLRHFIAGLREKGLKALIMKPVNMYQGEGVEKVDLDGRTDEELEAKFRSKMGELDGPVVVQPFLEEIYKGEKRAIYFNGKFMGAILKRPKPGSYMANIAQGASYDLVDLEKETHEECARIGKELFEKDGINLVAYDIIGKYISEINITCPGLVTHVSNARKTNIAQEMFGCQ